MAVLIMLLQVTSEGLHLLKATDSISDNDDSVLSVQFKNVLIVISACTEHIYVDVSCLHLWILFYFFFF